MSEWSSGYMADVEYVGSFCEEQAPSAIDFICLLNGIRPPTTNGRYAYCELGCGVGMTTTVLAAANPDADFYGIDFNPAHIARGRALADEAALTNLTFLESSFEELVGTDTSDLPMFDYITMHGVYTWVTPSIREDIVRFLRRYLKPGGAVLISYNALPAWGVGIGVQRLLHEFGRRADGGAERRIESAIKLAEKMALDGADFLKDNPILKSVLTKLEIGDRRYLAHEYLNDGWSPVFFADVARHLSEAKLSFVGANNVFANFLDLQLDDDKRDLLGMFDDPILRETVKDYCLPRLFRSDVFVRGPVRMAVPEQQARLRAIRLVLTVPRSRVSLKINVPRGEASVNKDVYEPIFDALAGGSRTLGELLDMESILGRSEARPVEVAGILIGSKQALPAVAGELPSDAAKRFNRALAYRSRVYDSKALEAFASPLFGTGLEAELVDRMCYAAIVDGVEPDVGALVSHVWGPIRDRGETMTKAGRHAGSESENLTIINEIIERFLNERMPVLKLAGAI